MKETMNTATAIAGKQTNNQKPNLWEEVERKKAAKEEYRRKEEQKRQEDNRNREEQRQASQERRRKESREKRLTIKESFSTKGKWIPGIPIKNSRKNDPKPQR